MPPRVHPESPLPADFPAEMNELSREVLGGAIEVHRQLGPGLLESVYETALAYELGLRGLDAERQVPISVRYKDVEIAGQRLDMLVEGKIIVEVKAVDGFTLAHEAQVLTYLKASGLRLGLLINFNLPRLIDGVRRFVM